MAHPNEKQLAESLRRLPPAPEPSVAAAKAIPRIRRQLDTLLPMIERDAELRTAMQRDLESALKSAGVEPDPYLELELRRRLTALQP